MKGLSVGRFSLGTFFPQSMPIFDKSGKLGIMIEGHVILDDTIVDSQGKGRETALRLLESYKAEGDRFVSRIRTGKFNLLILDLEAGVMKVISDRFGYHPLFFCLGDSGELVYANETKAILPYKKFDVDWVAVREFLEIGYLLGDRTYFKGISTMPPASIMTYDLKKGILSIKEYWRLKYHIDYGKDVDYFVEEAYRRLKTSCDRLYSGQNNYIVPLSGGLDSRTLISLFSGRKNVTSCTFDQKREGTESDIAGEVCKQLHVEHKFIPLDSRDAFRDYEDLLNICEGYVDLGLTFSSVVKRYTPKHVKPADDNTVIVDGFSGDVIYGANYYCKIVRQPVKALEDIFLSYKVHQADEDAIAAKLNPHLIKETQLRGLMSKEVFKQLENAKEEANKELLDYIKGYNAEMGSLEGTIEMFKIIQRGRRYVNSGGIYRGRYAEVVYPFFDYDVIDFYLTIPLEMRAKHFLYYKLYRKKFPELSKIRCVHTGIPPRLPFLLQKISKYAHYFKEGIIKRRVNAATKGRLCGKDSYADYRGWIRCGENPAFIMEKMNARVINKDYAAKLLKEHLGYKKDNSAALIQALSFGLWWAKYVEGHH